MLSAYHKPATITEAIDLLTMYGSKAKLMAGGTDIMVNYQHDKSVAECLISLSGLGELAGIAADDNGNVRVGAGTALSVLADDDLILSCFPLLAQAAAQVGCHSIRNRATIGGSLCNASPAGDLAPAVIALDGVLELISPQGTREVPAEQFFTGPGKTVLHGDEILAAVHVAKKERQGGSYLKLGIRQAMEISIAAAACVIEADSSGNCLAARLVLGAVAPLPLVVPECSQLLTGRALYGIDAELIKQVGALAAGRTSPISDIRASADYRRQMSQVLSEWVIRNALAQMGVEGC